MAQLTYNLAIETSGKAGQIVLGRGDELLAAQPLDQHQRQNLALMPAIAELCAQHGVEPGDLKELYVALGPGSFTGLRVALATVKMFALTRRMKVAGVPSLEVLAQNTPEGLNRAAVCPNFKRGTVYGAWFSRDDQGVMRQTGEAALRTLDEMLDLAPQPREKMAIVGDPLPDDGAGLEDESLTVLGGEAAACRGEALWRLGRERTGCGRFDDPATLIPLYIREPEAVTLWNQRGRRDK